jgi:hypothetical protein
MKMPTKSLFSTKAIGGLRFVRLGRISISFCICRPEGAPKRARKTRSTSLATVAPHLRSVVLPGGQRAILAA